MRALAWRFDDDPGLTSHTDAGMERTSIAQTIAITSLTRSAGRPHSLSSRANAPLAIRSRSRRSCWRQVPLTAYATPKQVTNSVKQVMWDTRAFNNKDDWPQDGSQPFVLSTGDRYVIPSKQRRNARSDKQIAPDLANMAITYLVGRATPSRPPWTVLATSETALSLRRRRPVSRTSVACPSLFPRISMDVSSAICRSPRHFEEILTTAIGMTELPGGYEGPM